MNLDVLAANLEANSLTSAGSMREAEGRKAHNADEYLLTDLHVSLAHTEVTGPL